jgi:hypothetical protein
MKLLKKCFGSAFDGRLDPEGLQERYKEEKKQIRQRSIISKIIGVKWVDVTLFTLPV